MSEVFEPISVGEVIHGRVSRVREDGKLVIILKQKAYIQMDEDSVQIYDTIGRLLKEGKIEITQDSIVLKK